MSGQATAADTFPFGPTPPKLTAEQLRGWILEDSSEVVVFNKPGWVVCHPSKDGPFSSLVGTAREILGLETVHLVSRLDRETSGLVVLARHRAMASALQVALAERRVRKRYLAILHGHLAERTEVSRALGPDAESPVAVKQRLDPLAGGQKAQTSFVPRAWKAGHTLAEVVPHTGRKHQIRAHAQGLDCPIVGDKLYGPDPLLYLEFVEHGWTARLEAMLPMKRQALHAAELVFETPRGEFRWEAPLAPDMASYWANLPGPETRPAGRDGSTRRRRRAAPRSDA
ncbi:MAG: RluA family pseudouridine synthase [Opitutales bacterium]